MKSQLINHLPAHNSENCDELELQQTQNDSKCADVVVEDCDCDDVLCYDVGAEDL
jgi:hypothetical protein